ncbi:MAG: glucosaminidase domain-containing protein [Tannerella sp.]|nr:glucosaminidase domain-containing protein [Tannerella sp.]
MRIFFTCLILALCSLTITGQKASRMPQFEEYIKKYKTLAMQQQKEYKIPASITLAQGLLESGAGNSRLAVKANNHFGIKCKEEWRGGRIYHDDDAKNECFRAYKSAEDSYRDHSIFLANRKYYVSLFTLDIYDYKAWAYGLQNCGYATDKSYGDKLVRLIETYELYKLDRLKQPAEKKKPAALVDDIYEIKVVSPEQRKQHPAVTNWRRRIQRVNGIHYIKAQENDSFEIIAYDTKLSLKRLLKYNEVTPGYVLKKGDMLFLQSKERYAPKENRIHVVAAGESMHGIAQLYGMRLKTLYKLNKLQNDYTPKLGDTLKLRK